MLNGPTFYVIQRPGAAAFFDARTGLWSRYIDSVQHYTTALRAAMDAHEWALEDMAEVAPYRMAYPERPEGEEGPGHE